MSNELLIEVGGYETRVALLEDGKLVEIHLERHGESGVAVGNIYKGRVSRVVPGIQAAFVDIGLARDAFLFAGDIRRDNRPIAEDVRQGQELLVQVVKEPLPGKGARISSQISLPGRFVVLLPGAEGVGVSRRIGSSEERERLELGLSQNLPQESGVIVRTAAEGKPVSDLVREISHLDEIWKAMRSRSGGLKAPSLVHHEAGLALRTIRDSLSSEIAKVWVEGAGAYDDLQCFLEQNDPDLVGRLEQHTGDGLLFDRFGIDGALARALRTRVWLKSGGFIVINPTEALVAIDVNSGRNTEGIELEATAHSTNLEAAEEIARQIRLRDLSGIIVVDFIDMLETRHQEELLETFESALASDRTRTQVSQMCDFGLVAVTRRRMRGGLLQRLTEPCRCCDGEGWVRDPVTIGLEIGRELRRRHRGKAGERVVVELHPRQKSVLEKEARLMAVLQQENAGNLALAGNGNLQPGEFVIRTTREP
jgi:ribonuclease G